MPGHERRAKRSGAVVAMMRAMTGVGVGVLLAGFAVGCAADKKPASSPTAAKAPESAATSEARPGGGADADDAKRERKLDAAPPPKAEMTFDHEPARTLAEGAKAVELAGTCELACSALASMDRAAGHLCGMASGAPPDDERRCTDAKQTVYSARARVKEKCGTCRETSVERTDPVPSRR